MDFGVTGKLGGYYLAEQYRKNAAGEVEFNGWKESGHCTSRFRGEDAK